MKKIKENYGWIIGVILIIIVIALILVISPEGINKRGIKEINETELQYIDPQIEPLFETQEEIRVIVYVKEGTTNEDIDKVLFTLDQGDFRLVRKSQDKNEFIIFVTKEGFNKLKINSVVSSIYYDRPTTGVGGDDNETVLPYTDPQIERLFETQDKVSIIVNLRETPIEKKREEKINEILSTLDPDGYDRLDLNPFRNQFGIDVNKENFDKLKTNLLISEIYYNRPVRGVNSG